MGVDLEVEGKQHQAVRDNDQRESKQSTNSVKLESEHISKEGMKAKFSNVAGRSFGPKTSC